MTTLRTPVLTDDDRMNLWQPFRDFPVDWICQYARAIELLALALARAGADAVRNAALEEAVNAVPLDKMSSFQGATVIEAIRALKGAPAAAVADAQPVAWLIDWPDEPDLGHYFAEEPSPTARSRALVLADTAPPAAQPKSDWLAEAESLVDDYRDAIGAGTFAFRHDARTALLAHLKARS